MGPHRRPLPAQKSQQNFLLKDQIVLLNCPSRDFTPPKVPMGKAGNFPGEARFPNLDLPLQQARGSQGWRICEERAKWTTNLPAGLSRCFPASRFSKRYSRFFGSPNCPTPPRSECSGPVGVSITVWIAIKEEVSLPRMPCGRREPQFYAVTGAFWGWESSPPEEDFSPPGGHSA